MEMSISVRTTKQSSASHLRDASLSFGLTTHTRSAPCSVIYPEHSVPESARGTVRMGKDSARREKRERERDDGDMFEKGKSKEERG